MDFNQYENYGFDRISAFNLATGFKDRSYHAHWHSYGEIVLAGPGESNLFRVNRHTYSLKEGDFLLVWPMEVHEIIDADRKESLIIQFSNAFMNSLFDLQRIMHFYRNLHALCRETHEELVTALRGVTERMKETWFSDARDRELRCCMLLMEFMLTLDQHREEFSAEIRENRSGVSSGTAAHRMILVTDYIKKNLTADDLSQSAMARLAGVSKEYFSRMFRSITGMNYSRWLNTIRMEKATELLADPALSLTEVAMHAGFQSISSFNRVFREEKGMSPREYRTLFRER